MLEVKESVIVSVFVNSVDNSLYIVLLLIIFIAILIYGD